MNAKSKSISEQAEALKKLMGPGWTGKLMDRTGLTRGTAHQIVQKMKTHHEHWHHVMDLARAGKQTLTEIEKLTT